MIRLEGVSKTFGSVEALRSLDLEIHRGQWLGLFGHNGSGKTTLLRILLGLSRPSAGAILIDGEAPNAERWLALHRELGFMPERIAFYQNMTGVETLGYFASLRGLGSAVVGPALESVGLAAAASRKVVEYSKGMRQRLNLAQALLGSPKLLVCDEPIEGLDPEGVRDFFRLIRSTGVETVVLSSHRISEVSSRVDRICVLGAGQIKALGSVEEIFEKLELPVRVHIYPVGSLNGTLDAAVKRLGATLMVAKDGILVVEVPQPRKTEFLLGLHACGDAIRHLHVEEPSLERVYFETD